MSHSHAWRRLLIAFSDASAAFEAGRSTPSRLRGGTAQRLLSAFSDAPGSVDALHRRYVRQAPHGRSPLGAGDVRLLRATVAGLFGFGLIGAACTTWSALVVGAAGAGVVAVLTLGVLALVLAAITLSARSRTAGAALGFDEDDSRDGFWTLLSSDERLRLGEVGREHVFPPGVPLVRQGYPADYVVVIRSGWAKVRVDRAGEERIVAVRGPGDLVGERALLADGSWSATVIALGTVHALLITAEDFTSLVARYPGVLSVLEKQVQDRLAEGPAVAARNELIDTEHRLAALITALTGARPSTVPITDHELASWMSSSPALIGSVLASWRDQGIVRTVPGSISVLDPVQLGQLTDIVPARADTSAGSAFWTGQDCTIMFVDIADFGAPARTETDRRDIRTTLFQAVRDAFGSADVSWGACHVEDRGDGLLIIVPPGTPSATVIDPLIPRLAAGLARHNRRAGPAQRLQVRVAVHVGPVLADPEGVSGEAIIRTARLLDAPEFRRRLDDGTVDLGLVVSPFVHGTIAGHASGFEQMSMETKDATTTAWVKLFLRRR